MNVYLFIAKYFGAIIQVVCFIFLAGVIFVAFSKTGNIKFGGKDVKPELSTWVFHGDGNLMPLMDDIMTLGMNCLHPIEPGAMDLKMVKEKYGDKVCLWGNIDMNTLSIGTPEEVEAEVKACTENPHATANIVCGSAKNLCCRVCF